jgi:Flp pilus assembly protein TadD
VVIPDEPLLRGVEPPRSLLARSPVDANKGNNRLANAARAAVKSPTSDGEVHARGSEASASTSTPAASNQKPSARAGDTTGEAQHTGSEPNATALHASTSQARPANDADPLAFLDGDLGRSDQREAPLQTTTRDTTSARPSADVSTTREPTSALLAQALSAFVSGRVDEAKTRYQQVLRSEPNNPAALRGMGLTATRLGDKKVARDSLRRYLEVSPRAADAAAIEARLATLKP